ncbi:L-fucose:H+ symporter permease [Siphonobacter sp. SORGH_AS_1065]|uniref:L-fucose:H+ symporter permease n=1 Tax=Siphonobacter sp. SORGH_AS_1065 TaxID=3041795 RepID=UPI0027847EB2|nr:L-fucose:H+ symporter permease [Siphonobacter sp. SORGH_AS_1065]MDQ1086138.1 FHS family L-fucose permease-like MFS transporter [Siphonobacter sp. SORGH_AS_1065]
MATGTAQMPTGTTRIIHPGNNPKASYLFPLILITCLFFLWGMANNLNDILIQQFKKAFELSDFQSGLVQSAFYLGYFVLALPASLIMRKYNYKTGIVIGLVLYALGAFLFVPAADQNSYQFFLFALFVIASGLAFLETAANPYVAVLGTPETASFRLNLVQAFNPIGCVTGIIVGQQFIFSGVEHTAETLSKLSPEALKAYYVSESAAVKMPYLVIGIVVAVFAVIFLITRFPIVKDEESREVAPSISGSILKKKHFSGAVIAQFFYVGAQVCIWSFLIRYIQYNLPGTPEKTAANYLIISLVLFTAGRFLGTALMKRISDHVLLVSYAIATILLVAVAILFPGTMGLWALVITSFFMSIMYPTIFSLGISGLGERAKLGSSILVMAIIGGAILTAAMGKLSDEVGITNALLIPLAGFVVVGWYGLKGYKL